jgi:hypothetical protein
MVESRAEPSAHERKAKNRACQISKICTSKESIHNNPTSQLDAAGIHIVELAKTALLGKRVSHLSTIMVDINHHCHCRVILNFIQNSPGYDFKTLNPSDPPDHYGQTYVMRRCMHGIITFFLFFGWRDIRSVVDPPLFFDFLNFHQFLAPLFFSGQFLSFEYEYLKLSS